MENYQTPLNLVRNSHKTRKDAGYYNTNKGTHLK